MNQAPIRPGGSRGLPAVQVAATGDDAANAGNAVAGSVAQDAAQDTVMSGRADGRRTCSREGQDDEERAKRQRTEKT